MTATDRLESRGDSHAATASGPARRRLRGLTPWGRVRFFGSWLIALVLVGVALPRTVDASWHGVVPVLRTVHWPAILALAVLWLLGLVVHSVVLTAAAPSLTHRRALTLNMTGSAVANVVPLGGAAGVELNRRMMKAWGIEAHAFTGYTFLTNLWDIGSKLLLPIIGILVLARSGATVTPQLRAMSLGAGVAFIAVAAFAAVLLVSPHGTRLMGNAIEQALRLGLRMVGRDRALGVPAALDEVRRQCAGIVAGGWVRMSAGITGYVALQCLLLGLCLQLTGAGTAWPVVVVAFAAERILTIVPFTPGGVGVADLGLIGVLLTLGGDPTGVTAAAVLYRLFIFAVEIPVGGGILGVWFLVQRRAHATRVDRRIPQGTIGRVAHVTDVFMPRLGGIETHVDDLVRHQRATGLDAHVLTPIEGAGRDPAWVHRTSAASARRAVTEYDAVHVHISMWSPYGISVARAAMNAGVPTLITVHSMWAGAGAILRLAALASLRRWPVAWSAVSAAAADAFRRSLGTSDVAVLPNAIDVAVWTPTEKGPRVGANRTHEGDTITLVSVMRLMPRKRPLPLLRMFVDVRRLVPDRDLRLTIVGDGPLRPRAERYVRRHGLTESVRITGRLPRPVVLDELRASTIYIAPAPKESFGIAALEARCAGLPVVAHRRSGVTEFIRDRTDGMLVESDTEMTVAVAELISNTELRKQISAHNCRLAPHHDWSDILDRTDELYRLAAERTRRTDPGRVPKTAPLAAGT